MLLFYAITIFIKNWLFIAGSEIRPVPRLNEPSRGRGTLKYECLKNVFKSLQISISGHWMTVVILLGGHSCQWGVRALDLADVAPKHEPTAPPGRGTVQVLPLATPGPMERLEDILWSFLFGHKRDSAHDIIEHEELSENTNGSSADRNKNNTQYPSGLYMRGELFRHKSSVHLPSPDLLHTEHCRLQETWDFMQTAVDAFAIILEGELADVLALPGFYVLRSARTIALMKIPQEKLSAMWDVVLGGRKPNTITYETLEIYRPLFKYLTGKQIARLNLADSRIVNYIGTHPDLTRHQVGVVASKYIQVNPEWRKPKYLNNMNNLLCGVPMTFMRKIEDSAYLRLEQQVFYHIRACDPLQRRFYLNMMTRTQALGKSFSWSARDVSRLGLLLAEVEGPALAAVSPDAMAGISSHVMAEMRPENLKYFTDTQVRYIKSKARNIMSRKLKEYDIMMTDSVCRVALNSCVIIFLFAINIIMLK